MLQDTTPAHCYRWQEPTVALLKKLFSSFWFSPHLQGLYLYGPPGRGKTYLVDTVAAQSNTPVVRHHFFSLCALLQEGLHLRQEQCFEEFFQGDHKKTVYIIDELIIEDITDAMIFSRWLDILTKKRLRLIITSNLSPESLYLGGLKRDHFLKTIDIIKKYCHSMKLDQGEDLRSGRKESPQVFFPLEQKAQALALIKDPFDQKILSLGTSRHLVTYAYNAQSLAINATNLFSDKAGKFDYRYLTTQFRVCLLCHLELFEWSNATLCKRFIAFIDYAFDHQVKIYFHGLKSLEDLKHCLSFYPWPERTYSRLMQISSQSWLAR